MNELTLEQKIEVIQCTIDNINRCTKEKITGFICPCARDAMTDKIDIRYDHISSHIALKDFPELLEMIKRIGKGLDPNYILSNAWMDKRGTPVKGVPNEFRIEKLIDLKETLI